MEAEDFIRLRGAFVRSAQWADRIGFELLLLHFAHGYLMGSFLSPLANQREDKYGGALENRVRFPTEVFEAVRAVWPEDKPLAVAINASDGVRGGITVEEAVTLAKSLKRAGCDLIEILAGQTIPNVRLPYRPGFLTPLSEQIRHEARIPTMVGGYLTTSGQVNTIIAGGRADLCVVHTQ
jgi:anthraniloyl-CoA monooxygenase